MNNIDPRKIVFVSEPDKPLAPHQMNIMVRHNNTKGVYIVMQHDPQENIYRVRRTYIGPVSINIDAAKRQFEALVSEGIGPEPTLYRIEVEGHSIISPKALELQRKWRVERDHQLRQEFFEIWLQSHHGFEALKFDVEEVL